MSIENDNGVKALREELRLLRSVFHVNMMRAYPHKSHDEIVTAIDGAVERASWDLPGPVTSSQYENLLKIIAFTYQMAGAHDAPASILDILADPESASPHQIEAMSPYWVKFDASGAVRAT